MKLTSSLKYVKFAVASLAVVAATAGAIGTQAMHGGHDGMSPFGGQHSARMVDRMLDDVKATDAQRAQIKQIVQAATADLKGQHEAHKALHEQMVKAFTQPTVDAAAVESLRQQQLALHDQSSKRVMQAMLDASKVLTPEQRKAWAEHMQKRHEMMKRHMRERRELEGSPKN